MKTPISLVVTLLFMIILTSCGSVSLSPEQVVFIAHKQEGDQNTNENASSITAVVDYIARAQKACRDNIQNCTNKFAKGIVIGGCSLSTCNGNRMDRLTRGDFFSLAKYTFTSLENPEDIRTITVDGNSSKAFFSKERYENIDFIKSDVHYDIKVYMETEDGESWTSEIQNMLLLNKKDARKIF